MSTEKTNLLEYLSQSNPELDCSKSSKVANPFNAKWDPIAGLEPWNDFAYNTVMEMYGHVLLQPISPLPETSPPLTRLEIFRNLEVFEDCVHVRLICRPCSNLFDNSPATQAFPVDNVSGLIEL